MAARNGKQEVLRWGTCVTSVGKVLAAFTERGLCAIRICGRTTDAKMWQELRQWFPRCQFVKDQAAANSLLPHIEADLLGKNDAHPVPLDLIGTPFQKRIWQALQRIPRGQVWSYSDLARRAGKPSAVRAAASACARNPVAILVPCHRVVRRDGGLGGYRWGLDCKRHLLKLEKAAI